MKTESLVGDYATTDQQIEAQNEIAGHLFGMIAKRTGVPQDPNESLAWQRGWSEA
jgi:hypothetical protein